MSLGGIAIALGMAVDADLVALEACHRRVEADCLGAEWADPAVILIAAAGSFAPAILTSLVIAASAFVPVFAFGGEIGRLLRPLAITKTLVIAAAALMTSTVAPALRDRLLRGQGRTGDGQPAHAHAGARLSAVRPFRAVAARCSRWRRRGWLRSRACPIVAHLGGEFLPRIDEGDSVLHADDRARHRPPEAASSDMVRQDEALAGHPEVGAGVRKGGPRRYRDGPGALVDDRDDDPAQAARRVAEGRPPALVLELGGTTRSNGCSALLWPEKAPPTTAELVGAAGPHTRLRRLDQRVDGADSRPPGHDVDGRAHAGRGPRSSPRRSGPPGRTGSRRSRTRCCGCPGTEERRLRVLRGARPGSRSSSDGRRLARHKVDPGLARAAPTWCSAVGGVGSGTRRHDPPLGSGNVECPGDRRRSTGGGAGVRCASRSMPAAAQPRPPRRNSSARPRLQRRDVRRTGQPVPLALLGRPTFVSGPAGVPHASMASRSGYVYVDLEPRDRPRRLRRAGARPRSTALAAGALAGQASGWSGPASTS